MAGSDDQAVEGLPPDEAFAALGNEVRVGILQCLWEAYEPYTESPLSFSALRDCVGVSDTGRFNYHLDQLTDHFVFRTDDGYRLTANGVRIAQSIVAGTHTERFAGRRAEIDAPCFLCGAPTAIEYRGRFFYHTCTACEGRVGTRFDVPEGTLQRGWIRPPGISDRDPEALFDAYLRRKRSRQAVIVDRVCPECSGVMDAEVLICDDHTDADEICDTCGIRSEVNGQWVCTVCKFAWRLPANERVRLEPAVVRFHRERGLAYDPSTYDDFVRFETWDQEVVDASRPTVDVTVEVDRDALVLTLDDGMRVVSVEGDRPTA